MNQSQENIIISLHTLEASIEQDANQAKSDAEHLLLQAERINFKYGIVYSKLLISSAHWHLMEYNAGFKVAKELLHIHQQLESDELFPLILHTLALHSWGQAKLFSAQQYWIQALEQSSLIGNNEIEIESLIGLGNIWRMTNNLEEASNAHCIAAQRASFYRVPHLEAKAHILQAWDNYLLHKYANMMPILFKAEELLQHNTNLTWKAEIYDFRGLAFLGLNDLNSAKQCCSYANQLAQQHNLVWMSAHSSISLARIATAQSHYNNAYDLLTDAELISEQFDKGELRSQICLEQSRIAELTNDYEHALYSYKRYRQYEISLLQEQTNSLGRDKSNTSKEQLDVRAKKLINRIKIQLEFNSISSLTYLLPIDKWQQIINDIALSPSDEEYFVIKITDNSPEKINNIVLLCHQYCKHGDSLTRLNDSEIALLLHENEKHTLEIMRSLSAILSTYPWHRYGLSLSLPNIEYFNFHHYVEHKKTSHLLVEN